MRLLLALSLALLPAALASDSLDGAREELRAGHTEKAIEILRAVLSKEPAAPDPSMLLGEILLSEEHFEEGDEVVENALSKNGQAPALHRLLGDLRYREGLIFEAEKEYKSALKLDRKNARAVYGISRIYQASSLRKKARELLQLAHAMDSQDPVIAAAFEATDRSSPAAVARMEAELARGPNGPEGEASARARQLKVWVAEAKALGDKTPFALAAPPAHYKIPLIPLMEGSRVNGTGVPVRINGATANIRFDTGAAGILLDNKFAERAGLQRIAETEIHGIGNDPVAKAWIGYVPRLEVGGVEFLNCIVAVREKDSAGISGGLIGSNIFQPFLVTINVRSRNLDLSPLPGPAWDGVTPVDRYDGPELADFTQLLIAGHYLLIPTFIGETSKTVETPGLVLFDTGAGVNMISTNLAPAISKVHDSQTRLYGVSGKVKMVYEADKVVLQFSHFRQLNLGLVSSDLRRPSRSAGVEISGILGLPTITMFESVTLDYRDGRIKFSRKP